jgi:signal transduction histidine kinase
LGGQVPALAYQQDTKIEFAINLRTAKALGLNVPHSLIARGDEVVLLNLVRNAIEAMETDKSEHRILQVSSESGGDKIIVAVEDSGPGIDPDQAENIFDAFVTTKSHGMGLGLALCRMIIVRHSGELTASSAHPRGSIFRIGLPISAATR